MERVTRERLAVDLPAGTRCVAQEIVGVDDLRIAREGRRRRFDPVIYEEQGTSLPAAIGSVRKLRWVFEPVGRFLEYFEGRVVPRHAFRMVFGEQQYAFVPLDHLDLHVQR